jgi:cell division protein FtsB
MTWPQIVAGAILVVIVIAVAGFFLGRQMQVLRELRRLPPETEEEERHLRRQTYRRIVSSTLLLLLGFLLATALLYLEGPAQKLAEERANLEVNGEKPELVGAERDFGRLYAVFWIGFLLILMTVVFLTAFDLWATRRHALREHLKIQADRRAMLEQQIARLRQERNNGPG